MTMYSGAARARWPGRVSLLPTASGSVRPSFLEKNAQVFLPSTVE